MCLGLWIIVFAARSKKEEMPGVGFTFLKIVVIIGLIKSCVLMLAGLVISVALVVSAWVSGVQTMIVAAVVTLVIMIVAHDVRCDVLFQLSCDAAYLPHQHTEG